MTTKRIATRAFTVLGATIALAVGAVGVQATVVPAAAKAAYCDDHITTSSATYMHDLNMRHGVYCWNWSAIYGRYDQAGDDEVSLYQKKFPGRLFAWWENDAWHPSGRTDAVDEHVVFVSHLSTGDVYYEETAWAAGNDFFFNDGFAGRTL